VDKIISDNINTRIISFDNKRKIHLILLMCFILLITSIAAICIGAYSIPPKEVFSHIASAFRISSRSEGVSNTIIWNIRMTRIILATAVGTALASSGAVYQGVFRNPLIEPYILGVSSGAALGAALAIMFKFPFSLQFLSFIFGFTAVFLTYTMSRIDGETPLVTLILSGVIIGSLFSALVSIFQYVGSQEQLRKLVFWLMGGLYNATWSDIKTVIPIILTGFIVIWLNSWKLNVLSIGEEEAKTLGINTERTKLILMIAATLITSISVSVVGIIGWVGLMIPHAARLMVGPDHRYLIPLSAILGAIFMIVCDTAARTISTGEIPIGIVTSLLGAPYLLYMLRKRKNYFGG
jgi:iron complex transport system permease protein